MYVDWEYYKIFYYVAKYQNFTKAARVLGDNRPNITHSMNRLESQLNCVLFTRSNRGVTLTPEGEMLYSRIASAAVQIQDAEEELSGQRHPRAWLHQHQRDGDGAEHLSGREAADVPHRVSRHPAAHLEPLYAPGGAGCEERRSGTCHHLHPGGSRTGPEDGGTETVL